MLTNLTYSVNAVMPILILVALGYFLKRFRFLTESFVDTAEKTVFKVALPVMLFMEVAKSSVSVIGDTRLIVFCIIGVTAAFLVMTVLAPVLLRGPTKRGAFIQGMCRSNFAILGVPLSDIMFGASGTQLIAVVMPFVILMYNAYSVIVLSLFSSDAEHKLSWKSIQGIFRNIVTNPLIIGVILALPFMLFQWEMPTVMDKSLGYISEMCTPLALLCLGANFKPTNLHQRLGYAVGAAVGKTVILPLVMVVLGAFLGFRGPSLGLILVLFGTPSAVSSYIMAKEMKNDGELAAQILLLTTVMCVVTLFIGIFLLKTLQLI